MQFLPDEWASVGSWPSAHLICTPVPGGLDCESEDEARPRQVPGDGVPEKVEGVGSGRVAFRTDVARYVGNGSEVLRVEVIITSHLVESWAQAEKKLGFFQLFFSKSSKQGLLSELETLPKPMRINDPTNMMAVCRVSV